MDDLNRIRENVRAVPYDRLVENIREATSGNEIDAEGRVLTTDLLREAMYTLHRQAYVEQDEVLYLMHPRQMLEWRENASLLYGAADHPTPSEAMHEVDGVPILVDANLPKAVVYTVDPDAISVGGTVIDPNRIVRLTGLKHPAADSE